MVKSSLGQPSFQSASALRAPCAMRQGSPPLSTRMLSPDMPMTSQLPSMASTSSPAWSFARMASRSALVRPLAFHQAARSWPSVKSASLKRLPDLEVTVHCSGTLRPAAR